MGRLRIIAGRTRGRRSVFPVGGHMPPASEFVRGALRDMIVHCGRLGGGWGFDVVADGRALDGEARLRGLAAMLVESGPATVASLRRSLSGCGGRNEAMAASTLRGPGRLARPSEAVEAPLGLDAGRRRRRGGTALTWIAFGEERP